MLKFKKILIVSLICACSLSLLSGCKEKQQPEEQVEEVVYEMKVCTADTLTSGKYYVKNGETFYELPSGLANETMSANIISKTADKERVLRFSKDDVCIPTLYSDDKLVFVSDTMPDSFVWERFCDDGYSIGIYGLELNPTNSYSAILAKDLLYPDSSFRNSIVNAGAQAGDEIVIDAINGTRITKEYVSESGSIKGLGFNKPCNVDVYKGSTYLSLTDVLADTHVFHSFECFETSLCNYTQANYIQVVVPETFLSGYYFINGAGFVRYINGPRSQGSTLVSDFNVPYYYYMEDGTRKTIYEVELLDNPVVEMPYTNIINVDCTNDEMNILFTFDKAYDINDDGIQTELSDSVIGLPELKLYGPDGEEFKGFTLNSYDNTIQGTIHNPISGAWKLEIYNAKNRIFNVETSFVSGHNDSAIQVGNGKITLSRYISDTIENGYFAVVWDNTNARPSDWIISTGEDKEKVEYTPETILNIKEEFGKLIINIGEIPTGKYDITLVGQDLGRISFKVGENEKTLLPEETESEEEVLTENIEETQKEVSEEINE